jgi:uncharacterized membrane protein YfcA
MSTLIWAVALAVTAGAAAVQGTVGIGFAMISVPILSLIHPDLAPAPQLIVALPLALSMAWRERSAIDLGGIGWIFAGRVPGSIVGALLLGAATAQVLDFFIGVVVLGAVAIVGSGVHIRRTAFTKGTAGAVSGVTGVVSSIGGPPLALIYSSEDSDTIRSTIAAVFSIGVTMSLFFRWAAGHVTMRDIVVAGILLPAVIVGLAVSVVVKDRVSKDHVRLGILVVSGLAALGLLIRAISV